MLGLLIEATRSTLLQEEATVRDLQRRDLLSDGQRLLGQHEAKLRKDFPTALLEIFAEGPSQARAQQGQRGSVDLDELVLMDDADVLAHVELARAQQAVTLATEVALPELDALVSAAQGLQHVQPEGNPLRPENYIRALQQVIAATGVSAEVRQLWMNTLRDQLGRQLVQTYRQAAQSLREHGVEPVGYARAQPGAGAYTVGYGSSHLGGGYLPSGPAPVFGHSSGHGAVGDSAYAAGYTGHGAGHGGYGGYGAGAAVDEDMLTAGMLRQMLAAGGDPFAADWQAPAMGRAGTGRAAHPGGSSYGAAAHGGAAGRTSPVSGVAASYWQASLPGGLSAGTGGQQGQASHDVVARMVDNISHDTRLLVPMQRAVQKLEPALQQLVRYDSGFFSNPAHPARQLLDEMTQRSLQYASEDAAGWRRFIHVVNKAVAYLATSDTRSAKPFARVLQALEKAWSHYEHQQLDREQLQQRQVLAEQVAADLRRLADFERVPLTLQAFITGPWADVVAHIRSGDAQSPDPQGYIALVPTLLRCAQPEQLRAQPRPLAAALLQMRSVIRDGLRSIDYPEEGVSRMLGYLSQLQRQAQVYASAPATGEVPDDGDLQAGPVTGVDLDIGGDAPQAGPESAEKPVAQAAPEPLPVQSPAEPDPPPRREPLLDADNLERLPQLIDPPELKDLEAAPAADAAPAEPRHYDLPLGQWVQIGTSQGLVLTRLTWSSPRNTLFLFTAPDGSTQSMTRRMIDKLSAEGVFQPVDAPPGAL